MQVMEVLKGPPSTNVPVSCGKTPVPLQASLLGPYIAFALNWSCPTKSTPASPEPNPRVARAGCSQALLQVLPGKGIHCYWRRHLHLTAVQVHKYVVLLITHQGKSGKLILQRDNSACRLVFYVFLFPSSFSTPPPFPFTSKWDLCFF